MQDQPLSDQQREEVDAVRIYARRIKHHRERLQIARRISDDAEAAHRQHQIDFLVRQKQQLQERLPIAVGTYATPSPYAPRVSAAENQIIMKEIQREIKKDHIARTKAKQGQDGFNVRGHYLSWNWYMAYAQPDSDDEQ